MIKNNIQLTDRAWKQFKIEAIFNIDNCKCSKVSALEKGIIPYVGATNNNNGVINFVKAEKKLITKGNCIAFICDGEGSVGYSVYKFEDFIGSTTIKVGRNDKLNKYNGIFITTVADTIRNKYNFGFKRNEKHLKNEILTLPSNKKGDPDFDFMELFIKQKEENKLKEYEKYITERIEEIKFFKEVPLLDEKEWKSFSLDYFFNVYTGGDLIIQKVKDGNFPVISHSKENNGIAVYSKLISGRRLFNSSSTISLADRGNFWTTTQPLDFYIGTRVKALEFRVNPNKFILKFFCVMINKQNIKFSYGNNATSKTDKINILLPIGKNGDPDYDYMENYIKKIEYEKLTNYRNLKINF
ncbi:MAG: hypothetical protein QM528_03185 [Phycisphaerales bacterium]|nr:hypothetical protein [Phycisphaerales bacterium]